MTQAVVKRKLSQIAKKVVNNLRFCATDSLLIGSELVVDAQSHAEVELFLPGIFIPRAVEG